jgi:transposase InsO family protein
MSDRSRTEKENRVLRAGDSWSAWMHMLTAALLEKQVVGYAIHDIPWIEPQLQPVMATGQPATEYQTALTNFMINDMKAYGLIMERLDKAIRPDFGSGQKLAKELLDYVASIHKPRTTIDYTVAKQAYNLVEMKSDHTTIYCERFQKALLDFKNATEQRVQSRKQSGVTPEMYSNFSNGSVTQHFIDGTASRPWLRTWRDLHEQNEQFTLDQLMSSLRMQKPDSRVTSNATNPFQRQQTRFLPSAATTDTKALDNDEPCYLHPDMLHTNAGCYTQHPDRRPRRQVTRNNIKPKGKSGVTHGKSNKPKSARPTASAIYQQDNDEQQDDSEFPEGLISTAIHLPASTAASLKGIHSASILYDSGSSHHIFNDKRCFTILQKRPPTHLALAIGTAEITMQGNVPIILKSPSGKEITLTLKDCLYTPRSPFNIVSGGKLWHKAGISHDQQTGHLMYKNKAIGTTTSRMFVPFINATLPKRQVSTIKQLHLSAPAISNDSVRGLTELWHQRLGHVGSTIIAKTMQLATGLEGVDTSTLDHCRACKLSMAHRMISRERRTPTSAPLDEIHIDTIGPIHPMSLTGCQYILLLTDARTRYRWAFPMAHKRDATTVVRSFIQQMITQHHKTPKIFFSDKGGEFINHELSDFAQKMGIRWDTSAPYTPEQNGIAESSNKVICGKARTMLIDSGFSPQYWEYAIQYAVLVTNSSANLLTKQIPRSQMDVELHGHEPQKLSLSDLKRFGCRAFIYNNDRPKSHKFEARAHEGWFLGFQPKNTTNAIVLRFMPTEPGKVRPIITETPHAQTQETWVLQDEVNLIRHHQQASQVQGEQLMWNLDHPELLEDQAGHQHVAQEPQPLESIDSRTPEAEPAQVSRSATTEMSVPFQGEDEVHQQASQSTLNNLSEQHMQPTTIERIATPQNISSDMVEPMDILDDHENPNTDQHGRDPPDIEGEQDEAHQTSSNQQYIPITTPDPLAGHKRHRVASPPPQQPPQQHTTTLRGRKVMRMNYKDLNTGKHQNTSSGQVVAVAIQPDPTSVNEALNRPDATQWKQAMLTEFNSLKAETFQFVPKSSVPKDKTILTGKWVFKLKLHPNGQIDKYKARWTARGFIQKEGVDYKTTFAPTPRASTNRLLLALSV